MKPIRFSIISLLLIAAAIPTHYHCNAFAYPAAKHDKQKKHTEKYTNGDVYTGGWRNGMRNGNGKLKCADGRIFEGEWVNDDLRYGKLTYKNTGYYEGYFRNLKLDGYGERHYPDKTVKGFWKNDNRHGIVTETDSKGKKQTAFYRKGIKMENIKVKRRERAYGLDLSAYQENVVWQDLFICGNEGPDYRLPYSLTGNVTPLEFVIMKATEGGDHVDRMLKVHRDNAERHNFVKGYYHFYNTTASATANAANYIRNVKLEKGDFPPILDIEKDGVPVDSLVKWLKIVERHYGKQPMIYTNERYYKKYVEGTKLAKYPLWYSRFGRKDIDRGCHILQFTEDAVIDGVKNHKVDLNEFRRNDLDHFIRHHGK